MQINKGVSMKSRKKEKQEKMYNIVMAISVIAIMVMYFGGNDSKLQELNIPVR